MDWEEWVGLKKTDWGTVVKLFVLKVFVLNKRFRSNIANNKMVSGLFDIGENKNINNFDNVPQSVFGFKAIKMILDSFGDSDSGLQVFQI